ncbi:hypothetical protein C8Q80DRAFT_1198064 [Daedaleopsis nitida]|nr:hypothetical protein C8Q80DRAFT_1198064 [Daedaleopsis nitida]
MQFSLAALVLAAAAAVAHAQSTPGISPCIINCISQSQGCSSIADVQCFCTNTEFQQETFACLQKSCTAEDIAQVEALEKQWCGSSTCEY